MRFYSTSNRSSLVSLQEAVLQGLAPDGGLFMPESLPPLPASFIRSLGDLSFADISFAVADHLIGEDIPRESLRAIVDHTIQFDAPLIEVEDSIYALELFHGPTLAFKDFGARFLSGLLGHFARAQNRDIVILVATSGDTGSAVANGFLNVPGTRVVVLYPSGKVSPLQEKQFTTLGGNITALEVDGTFDDCQRLVKQAFLDDELRAKLMLASANSINIARLIPQTFYYFSSFAQLQAMQLPVVYSVPSGNFGNLTAGLIARRMGLPISHFIASTNINDIVPEYLDTGIYAPRPSHETISNAMDVGTPSNFARMMDLYHEDRDAVRRDVTGYSFSDEQTREAMRTLLQQAYVADPHGAVAYLGVKKYLAQQNRRMLSVFLETAHPAKFIDVVQETLAQKIDIPEKLQHFLKAEKKSIPTANDFTSFKRWLLNY